MFGFPLWVKLYQYKEKHHALNRNVQLSQCNHWNSWRTSWFILRGFQFVEQHLTANSSGFLFPLTPLSAKQINFRAFPGSELLSIQNEATRTSLKICSTQTPSITRCLYMGSKGLALELKFLLCKQNSSQATLWWEESIPKANAK